MGTEPYGSLSKIKRRTNCAESGSGHFVLLRSDDQEIAKTFRDVSRSSASNSEICSRPGSNAHRTAQAHSSGTAPVSQRTEVRGQRSEDRGQTSVKKARPSPKRRIILGDMKVTCDERTTRFDLRCEALSLKRPISFARLQ